MSWGNGKRGKRIVQCLRCGNTKFHEARGLCKPCYNRCHEDGTLDSYPTTGGYGSFAGAARMVRLADLDPQAAEAERLRRDLDPRFIPQGEVVGEEIYEFMSGTVVATPPTTSESTPAPGRAASRDTDTVEDLEIIAEVHALQAEGMSRREAIAAAADALGVSTRRVRTIITTQDRGAA